MSVIYTRVNYNNVSYIPCVLPLKNGAFMVHLWCIVCSLPCVLPLKNGAYMVHLWGNFYFRVSGDEFI